MLKIFESGGGGEDRFGRRLLALLRAEVTAAVADREIAHIHKREWIEKLSIDSIHMKEGYTFQKSVWLHLVEKGLNSIEFEQTFQLKFRYTQYGL